MHETRGGDHLGARVKSHLSDGITGKVDEPATSCLCCGTFTRRWWRRLGSLTLAQRRNVQ